MSESNSITPKDDFEYCKSILSKLTGCYSYLDLIDAVYTENKDNNIELKEIIETLINKIGIDAIKLLLFEINESHKKEENLEDFNYSLSENTEEITFLSKKRLDSTDEDSQDNFNCNQNSKCHDDNENIGEYKTFFMKEKENPCYKLIKRNLEGDEKIINVLFREEPDDEFINCFVIANINKDYRAYMFCHDRKCKARAYYDIRKKEIEILIGHSKEKSKHAYLSCRCKLGTYDNIKFIRENPGIVGIEITKGYKNVLDSIYIIRDTNLNNSKNSYRGRKRRNIEIKLCEKENSLF